MVRRIAVAALLIAALGIAIAGLRPRSPPPLAARDANRGTRKRIDVDERDGRRRSPGVHRAGPKELAVRNRVAAVETAKIERLRRMRAQGLAPRASVAATTWVSLGPSNAFREFNVVAIDGVDSGRPNSVVVDPRDPNVVYMAGSGAGVWKTINFLSSGGATWTPLGDALPNLAVGALAIDGAQPDTLYLGNGDFVDGSGNTIWKSSDGGASWGTPVVLTGVYPGPSQLPASVNDIRAIGVRGAQVLAGTNVGLFASSDAGTTFALVDLPNVNQKTLLESIWSVVQLGNGHWVASGLTGCDEVSGPASVFGGVDPGPTCEQGNNGEIWTSPDGMTWALAVQPVAAGIGRITLAAGTAPDPATAVVYAYVGSTDGTRTAGFWRSKDGGLSWSEMPGTLANPTNVLPDGSSNCPSLDLGQAQTWYNQAIVVDPTNPNHVLAGGSLCSARTLNGTAPSPTWELVSHWLPNYEGGVTKNGKLGYVHADWHTATSIATPAGVRTFAGTDGGVFSSTNLFDPATTAEAVTWTNHNRGLVSHLMYALGSGDPVTANPFVLFAGLQDNGTRYRADPKDPSVFNQPVGGDGIGATVHVASSGTTYWGSVQFSHVFCQPGPTVDCADGINWLGVDPVLAVPAEPPSTRVAIQDPSGEDSEPFLVHYANVETDSVGQSVLTHTTGQIFVAGRRSPTSELAWTAISQDLTPEPDGLQFANVSASRTVAGLYGAPTTRSRAPFLFTTAGTKSATWTVARPVFPLATGGPRLTGASAIDFPPVLPTGTAPGQVFIGAFTGVMNNGNPPPDDRGRLWRTTDAGTTWSSIVGADPAHRLPNVPIYVVKYDPVTATTIYAGTDLGVYFTIDDGGSWNRMGEGFPVVPVRDLYVAKNQEFIRAATYGRGLWEIYPSAAANQGTPGNGDYDRNLRFNWIDLAAMSARLGVTPATTVPPLYTWFLDLSGADRDLPVQRIDDADLVALLAIFGGRL